MSATVLPFNKVTDDNDDPISGAVLRFYEVGTLTPKEVFSNVEKTSTLGYFVTCDASGSFPQFYSDLPFKVRVELSEIDSTLITEYENLGNDIASVQVATENQLSTSNVQNSIGVFGVTGGGSNAYTLTLSPPITGYVIGQSFKIKAHEANTGAASINVNNVGVVGLKNNTGNNLLASEILAGGVYTIIFDGGDFKIANSTDTTVPSMQANQINEATTDAGVTIEGILHKDGLINGDLEGDVTGNVTGNVTGDVTGNINASTLRSSDSKIYFGGNANNDFIEFDEATNEYRFWENKEIGNFPSADLSTSKIVGGTARTALYDGQRIDLDYNNVTTNSTNDVVNAKFTSTNTDNITADRTKQAGHFNATVHAPSNGESVSGKRFFVDGIRSYAYINGGVGDVYDIYGIRSYSALQSEFTGDANSLQGGFCVATANNDGNINICRGLIASAESNADADITYMYGGDIQANPNGNATGSADYLYGLSTAINDDSGGNFNVNVRKAVHHMQASGTLAGAGDTYGIYQDGVIENNRLIGGIDLDTGDINVAAGDIYIGSDTVPTEIEGIWIPTATTSGGGTVEVLTVHRAKYDRVGDFAHVNFAVKLGAITGPGGFIRLTAPMTADALQMTGGRWVTMSHSFANINAIDTFLEDGQSINAASGEIMVSGNLIYFNQGNAWNYLGETLSQHRSVAQNTWVIGTFSYRVI